MTCPAARNKCRIWSLVTNMRMTMYCWIIPHHLKAIWKSLPSSSMVRTPRSKCRSLTSRREHSKFRTRAHRLWNSVWQSPETAASSSVRGFKVSSTRCGYFFSSTMASHPRRAADIPTSSRTLSLSPLIFWWQWFTVFTSLAQWATSRSLDYHSCSYCLDLPSLVRFWASLGHSVAHQVHSSFNLPSILLQSW